MGEQVAKSVVETVTQGSAAVVDLAKAAAAGLTPSDEGQSPEAGGKKCAPCPVTQLRNTCS